MKKSRSPRKGGQNPVSGSGAEANAAPAGPANGASTVAASDAASTSRPWLLTRLLPSLALVVVAVFALRRLDDFDTWWHLASGRWIAQHHAIPHSDVLSFTVPQNDWTNLQWLYDLLLYAVWSIGGANLLVLASAACFVGTFAILAKHLRLYVGSVTTALLLVWVAATVNERFLIRPEMATFPLLAAVQLLLARGRDDARQLRWLLPVMLLWANTHSLFILGIGAIACSIGGALVAELPLLPAAWRRDSAWAPVARRELLRWGGAAIAVTLVNPYFLHALLFPLELMTRINGSSPVYGVIGEFRPPFSGYFPTFAIGSYQAFLFFAAGLALVAGILRALAPAPRYGTAEHRPGEEQRYDVGALVFALALGYLSLLARRNIGVFAIGAVPFLGACAGIVLARLPGSVTAPSSTPARALSALTALAMLVVAQQVVTNRWYAMTGETHEFGLGVLEGNFQARADEFFREQKLPGPTWNDMTAGGFLTWDDPSGRGVYVDGRLEVYDTPFFGAYLSNMSNFQAWRADADARGIQSATVFHRWANRHGFIRAMMSQPDWRLVYFDETVVTFVRVTGNEAVTSAARQAFTGSWRGRTDAVLSSPPDAYSWQWKIGRYTAQLAYARVLETLGDAEGTRKWLEAALATGLPPDFEVSTRQKLAQYLASAGQLAQARMQLEKALAVQPDDADLRAMLAKLDGLSH